MTTIPTITFRRVRRTTRLDSEILERQHKLDLFYPQITKSRVLVELVQRRHQAGNRYHVRIELTVPGETISVSHEAAWHVAARGAETVAVKRSAESGPEHKHVRVALRDAFDAARRKLQDYARRQRGDVKRVAGQTNGRVSQLFPLDEYGYIEDREGREIYFQKTSVLSRGFNNLTVGSEVSFVEELGKKGLQASTVRLLHPRRARKAARPKARTRAAG
jgi:cold shock CspA family protein